MAKKKSKPADEGSPPLTDFPEEFLAKYFPGGFTVRDEANALVHQVFRAGPIEDLHAGKHTALLDDPSLSRITNAEMKRLMIAACEKLTVFLQLRQDNHKLYDLTLKTIGIQFLSDWER
ncbi:hypothetical protein V5E97_10560 [Singulisphaera sp. Ch08]|uniref:Uncharacterized protein n=1 Tax=Singulisphaera sp. Ch08 TaxID=3120278 RepID=A0AAU7CPC4_9BACT